MTHPLSDFHFCPHCGSRDFAEHDPFSKRCGQCGFTFYPNAAAATVAVVQNERGELLCVVRGREPGKGTLDLPGGFVDPGESLTEGLARELREEVGAALTAAAFLFSFPNAYPFSGHTVHTCDAFFRCRIANAGAVRPADDAAAIRWIAPEALRPEDFGLGSVRRGVERLLQEFL